MFYVKVTNDKYTDRPKRHFVSVLRNILSALRVHLFW